MRDGTNSSQWKVGSIDIHLNEYNVWRIIAMAFLNSGEDTQWNIRGKLHKFQAGKIMCSAART